MTKASSGSVSSYAAIPPGTWTMSATGPSAEANLPVTLADNTVHTEVVIDGSSGLEIINLVDAAGEGQPPTGGANTGFGGTAAHGPGSPLPWAGGHRRRDAAGPDGRYLAAPQPGCAA